MQKYFVVIISVLMACSSGEKKVAEPVVAKPKATKKQSKKTNAITAKAPVVTAFDPEIMSKIDTPEMESSGECIDVANRAEKESGLKHAAAVYEVCCRASPLNPTPSVECDKVLEGTGRLVSLIRPYKDKKGKFSSIKPFIVMDWRTLATSDFKELKLYDMTEKDRKLITKAMDANRTAEFLYRTVAPASLSNYYYYAVTSNGIEEAKVSGLSGAVRFYKSSEGNLSVPVFDGTIILTTASGAELSGFVIVSKEPLVLTKADHAFTNSEKYRTQSAGEIDSSVLADSWTFKVLARPVPSTTQTRQPSETPEEPAVDPSVLASEEYVFVDLPKNRYCGFSHIMLKTRPGRTVVHENFSDCD